MADQESGLLPSNEGVSSEGAVQAGEVQPEEQKLTAEEIQRLPPELRPGPDGRPPQITEKLLRQMRAHYFTVKHVRLENCGHKLDMMNQPKNNCESCWWQWFLHHPQLVETTDQFYRTQGKGPLIAMRGLKYTRMFFRFMATYIRFQKEAEALKAQEKANESAGQSQPGTLDSTVEEAGETTASSPSPVEG